MISYLPCSMIRPEPARCYPETLHYYCFRFVQPTLIVAADVAVVVAAVVAVVALPAADGVEGRLRPPKVL